MVYGSPENLVKTVPLQWEITQIIHFYILFITVCVEKHQILVVKFTMGTPKDIQQELHFQKLKKRECISKFSDKMEIHQQPKHLDSIFQMKKNQKWCCVGDMWARAHIKLPGEYAKQKSFSVALQDIHKKKFPNVLSVRCHCPKRHSKNCGCFSKIFLHGAWTNFCYCLINLHCICAI